MTESEWLATTDRRRMLEGVRGLASARKLRLFAVACCRTIEGELFDEGRRLLDAVEACADAEFDGRQLNALKEAALAPNLTAYASYRHSGRSVEEGMRAVLAAAWVKDAWAWQGTQEVQDHCGVARRYSNWKQADREFSDLLRCIFGNPFRPVAFIDPWRSETAVALAAGIHAERAFDRLPILADALEEAGCDQPDVLSHCRQPGPHARGCWVVDGVLGKSKNDRRPGGEGGREWLTRALPHHRASDLPAHIT